MTQPAPTNPLDAAEEEELPPPLLRRMVSAPFFPEQGSAPILWQVQQQHPLKSNAQVVRMFLIEDGVEIYSTETIKGGIQGMRNFVPMHWVRLTEEIIHPDIMSDEIEAAEARVIANLSDLDDDDPEPEPEPASASTVPPPAPAPANGQVAS